MASITLSYFSGGTEYEQSVEILSIRGMDDVDSVMLVPAVRNDFVDGTASTQFKGFRRVITIDCGVQTSNAVRKFINRWHLENTKTLTYNNTDLGIETVYLVNLDAEIESEWKNDTLYGRSFKIVAVEHTIRTAWTNYTPPSTVDIMYIKNNVEIVGTEDSPETFVTNSGKLSVMETGESYPPINLSNYVATVICPNKQGATIQISSVTQSGANITFTLAVANGGNPYSDGKFYADIIIGLQARP